MIMPLGERNGGHRQGRPPVASAHRPATKAETAVKVYRASGRYYGGLRVSEPRAAPAQVF
jgi:hypothetical protein